MINRFTNKPIINTLIIIVCTAIIAKSIGMLVLHLTNTPHSNLAVLDSFFLAILMVPVLYAFVFRPIRKSDECFQLFAEYTSDWEYWQDEDGSFLYTTPSVEKVTGYEPKDFSSDKDLLNKIILHEDLEIWTGHVHTMSSKGFVEPIEFRIKTKSGDIRWIHHVCQKVYNKKGKKRGVRGSNRDITEHKKLQDEVKVLRGFLPICASCKKIRDDKGYWNQIESYIQDHSEAKFSHGICPECANKLYPEFFDNEGNLTKNES